MNENTEENPYHKKEQRRRELVQTNEYIKTKNRKIMTSRFNNSTWNENKAFLETKPKLGCTYCSPTRVSKDIPVDSVMFILEMNNDTNKMMGIGMVINHPYYRKYRVYQNHNYNRYMFVGKHRIDRSSMDETEERIMKALDIICFKGNHHMKRGQGLLSFPQLLLYRISSVLDLVDFINTMFDKRNLFKKK
jgi:hypothetical protein